MFGGNLRTTTLSGGPDARGSAHGSAHSDAICKYLCGRIDLASEETWSGASLVDHEMVLDVAESTLAHHEKYSEPLYAEMVAMAGAAGITPAEAVVVGGFTDLTDVIRSRVGSAPVEHNCTAVLNPARGFHAQTWDMHASAGEFVIIIDVQPDVGPRSVLQTTTGCLGQMGMNEAGVSVGINNLTSMGRPGVTWPTVVRKVLAQTKLDKAVDAIVGADLAGGHNFMVMGPDGVGVNIEAMPDRHTVVRVDGSHVHSNHCVDPVTAREEGRREPEHVENSHERLDLAAKLADDVVGFFEDPLISRRATDLHDVATCGAVVFEPAAHRMSAVWGVPGDHPWQTFTV